jgi:dephospho-CoA kinase
MVLGFHDLIVGLTGGIGSGKSAVSELFSQQGIDVIDADLVARQVVEPGTEALSNITAKFGQEILRDGALDRQKLRSIIFNDEVSKKWLEELLHPIIRKEMFDQIEASNSPYTILEAPLLFENNLDKFCNKSVVVDTSEASQLARTLERDDSSSEVINNIIQSQIKSVDRLKRADYIIDNNGEISDLGPQVIRLNQILLLLAQTSDFK